MAKLLAAAARAARFSRIGILHGLRGDGRSGRAAERVADGW